MDIKFHVNRHGHLYDFEVPEDLGDDEISEFVIPSKVDSQEVYSIGRLSESFSKLKNHGVKRIKRVIIEEGVEKIKNWAFAKIDIEIDAVLWPTSCENISPCCFYKTPLKAIKGIEYVKEIGAYAFERTHLKTITWPSNCEKIPTECFSDTPLEEVTGIEHVKEIGECAFAYTKLKNITWPVDCERIPANCFRGSTIEEIIFPAGGVKDIDLYDFTSSNDLYDFTSSNVNIKKIDLSALGIVNFIKGHPGVDYQKLYEKMKSILKLPYYVNGLE